MAVQQTRQRLSAHDWARAALAALLDGGVAAVAVEPLAVRLGATKGSFYWHYADRGALVDAALALWEAQETDAVIAELADVDEPQDRLRLLVELIMTIPQPDPVALLLRDVDDPRVGRALERVSRRRLDYVVEQLVACGVPETQAQTRGAVVLATYLGWSQLRRVLPDAAPYGPTALPHVELVQQLLGLS